MSQDSIHPPTLSYAALPQASQQQVLAVAKYQKTIIWLVLIQILGILIPLISLLGILTLIYIYKLAKALEMRVPVLLGVLAAVPLVGLFVLLKVNSNATKLLRANGIRVGLMGSHKQDIARLTQNA